MRLRPFDASCFPPIAAICLRSSAVNSSSLSFSVETSIPPDAVIALHRCTHAPPARDANPRTSACPSASVLRQKVQGTTSGMNKENRDLTQGNSPCKFYSDPDEYLLLIHPIQNQPVGQQRQHSKKERLQRSAHPIQKTHAQVNLEAALHKLPAPLRHHVSRNRVHSHHHQRKRNLAILLHINDPRERREKNESHAAAPKHPGRRPDALHNRANPGEVQQQCRRHQRNRRNQKSAHRNLRSRSR